MSHHRFDPRQDEQDDLDAMEKTGPVTLNKSQRWWTRTSFWVTLVIAIGVGFTNYDNPGIISSATAVIVVVLYYWYYHLALRNGLIAENQAHYWRRRAEDLANQVQQYEKIIDHVFPDSSDPGGKT